MDIPPVKTRVRKPRTLHPCPQCGKSFTKRSNMLIHARIHTGERPYVCKYAGCGRTYKWLSSINFHQGRCDKQSAGMAVPAPRPPPPPAAAEAARVAAARAAQESASVAAASFPPVLPMRHDMPQPLGASASQQMYHQEDQVSPVHHHQQHEQFQMHHHVQPHHGPPVAHHPGNSSVPPLHPPLQLPSFQSLQMSGQRRSGPVSPAPKQATAPPPPPASGATGRPPLLHPLSQQHEQQRQQYIQMQPQDIHSSSEAGHSHAHQIPHQQQQPQQSQHQQFMHMRQSQTGGPGGHDRSSIPIVHPYADPHHDYSLSTALQSHHNATSSLPSASNVSTATHPMSHEASMSHMHGSLPLQDLPAPNSIQGSMQHGDAFVQPPVLSHRRYNQKQDDELDEDEYASHNRPSSSPQQQQYHQHHNQFFQQHLSHMSPGSSLVMQNTQHSSSNITRNNESSNNNNRVSHSGGNSSLPTSSGGGATYQHMHSDNVAYSHHEMSSNAIGSSYTGGTSASRFNFSASTTIRSHVPPPLPAPRKTSAVSTSNSTAMVTTGAPTSPVTPHAITGPTLLSYPTAIRGIHSPVAHIKGNGGDCTAVSLPRTHTEPVAPDPNLYGHPTSSISAQQVLTSSDNGNGRNESGCVDGQRNNEAKQKRLWSSINVEGSLPNEKYSCVKTEAQVTSVPSSAGVGTSQSTVPCTSIPQCNTAVACTTGTTTGRMTPRSPQSVASNDVHRMLGPSRTGSNGGIRSVFRSHDGNEMMQPVSTGSRRMTQLSSAVEGMTLVPGSENLVPNNVEHCTSNESRAGETARAGDGNDGQNGNIEITFRSDEFLVGQCGTFGSNGLLDEISGEGYENGESDGMVMFH